MKEVNFGEYLRNLRKSKNLSIVQLSEVSGVSNPYISQIENNKFTPSMEVISKLAEALNIRTVELAAKAGYLNEDDITLSEDEEKRFDTFAFLQTSEELYNINQQLKEATSEKRLTLLERKERLEKRISRKWHHYDIFLKYIMENLKQEIEMIEMNKQAFKSGIATPVFTDEQNNINIQIYKDNELLNKQDCETLNAMIKGFLFDKKFIDYREQ